MSPGHSPRSSIRITRFSISAMVLLYVPDRRAEDTRVKFDGVPETGAWPWNSIPRTCPPGATAALMLRPAMTRLVDAPVEIGEFDEFRIEAGGRPIRIVVHGDAGDRTRLSDALKRIVDYEVSLMGGAPFREYMFLFHVGSEFRRRRDGALELHGHLRGYPGAIAQLFGARIFSHLEREADSPAVPRAGGLHEGNVDARRCGLPRA